MRKIILIILLLSAAASIYASDKKIITILDLETNEISEMEMTLIVDLLASSVMNYEEYIFIDEQQRETILAETRFSNSGCAEESCAVEIGHLLSANEMVVGSLGSVGAVYLINLQLIDVGTGTIINTVSRKFGSKEAFVDGCEAVITELLGNDGDNSGIKNDFMCGLGAGLYLGSDFEMLSTGLNLALGMRISDDSYIGLDYSVTPLYLHLQPFNLSSLYSSVPPMRIGISYTASIDDDMNWGFGIAVYDPWGTVYSAFGIFGMITIDNTFIKTGTMSSGENGKIINGISIELGYISI